jgi:hypothetical protein
MTKLIVAFRNFANASKMDLRKMCGSGDWNELASDNIQC